ncbi:hypothetical protein BH09MYX1_BH09MYX1_60990 [soil metagenome]
MEASSLGTLGRYTLLKKLGSGGMATVYLARMQGLVGTTRDVAIKRIHDHLASDVDHLAMFQDEARIAMRLQHPNIVQTFDVVSDEHGLYLVMDYVAGASLSAVMRRLAGRPMPLPIASALTSGFLGGLHAAHESVDQHGSPLGVIHRDVSPQNVLVGSDGAARILDFGIAKAAGRLRVTVDGAIRGKLSYMAPEQLLGGELGRATDIFAAGVILWELLVGKPLFANGADLPSRLAGLPIPSPSKLRPELPRALEALVLRALSADPRDRFQTAEDMARALEASVRPATSLEVARWLTEAHLVDHPENPPRIVLDDIERAAAGPDGPVLHLRREKTGASVVLDSVATKPKSSPTRSIVIAAIAASALAMIAAALAVSAHSSHGGISAPPTVQSTVSAVTTTPSPKATEPSVIAPPLTSAPQSRPATAHSVKTRPTAGPSASTKPGLDALIHDRH